jgi:RHH-type transcriptional regulator, rel operon repressor / antitoxin RelB
VGATPTTHDQLRVDNVYTRARWASVAESVPLTAREAPRIAARLRSLAAVKGRSVSHLVAEALERYLADEEWQVAEIQAAIAEAAAPDAAFVDQAELEAWAEQVQVQPETPPPTGQSLGNRAPAA